MMCLSRTPLQPTKTKLARRRMKSPVASSSICSRSKALGLNLQSNPSSVLLSAKRACPVSHTTLAVHRAVEDLGGVVGVGGQGKPVRLLFLVEIDGPALRFVVEAQVGGAGQPVGRDLLQMLERGEGPAVEQV